MLGGEIIDRLNVFFNDTYDCKLAVNEHRRTNRNWNWLDAAKDLMLNLERRAEEMKLDIVQETALIIAIEKSWKVIFESENLRQSVETTTVVEWSITNDRLLTHAKSQLANDLVKQMVQSLGWYQTCRTLVKLIDQGAQNA